MGRQIEKAEQDYDLNKAAELKYGKLPELQKQLEAEGTPDRGIEKAQPAAGQGDRGGDRPDRRAVDRDPGRPPDGRGEG